MATVVVTAAAMVEVAITMVTIMAATAAGNIFITISFTYTIHYG